MPSCWIYFLKKNVGMVFLCMWPHPRDTLPGCKALCRNVGVTIQTIISPHCWQAKGSNVGCHIWEVWVGKTVIPCLRAFEWFLVKGFHFFLFFSLTYFANASLEWWVMLHQPFGWRIVLKIEMNAWKNSYHLITPSFDWITLTWQRWWYQFWLFFKSLLPNFQSQHFYN